MQIRSKSALIAALLLVISSLSMAPATATGPNVISSCDFTPMGSTTTVPANQTVELWFNFSPNGNTSGINTWFYIEGGYSDGPDYDSNSPYNPIDLIWSSGLAGTTHTLSVFAISEPSNYGTKVGELPLCTITMTYASETSGVNYGHSNKTTSSGDRARGDFSTTPPSGQKDKKK